MRVVLCALSAVCLVVVSDSGRAQDGASDSFTYSDETPFRFRKTLFSWNYEPRNAEEEPEENDRLVTDRPHFSEASSLVGLGRVQIETGYTRIGLRDGNQALIGHSFPETLFRIGMLAEWFELRIGYNYGVEEFLDPIGMRSRNSGSQDLYVAAKLALAEQRGVLPEMAIFPQLRVPTGSRVFTDNQPLPGFLLAYSWKLADWLELECNTQLNRRRDDADHFYTEFIQTVNVEYDLTEHLGAYTEWFCFVPSGAVSANALPQHYFNGGFQIYFSNNVQLDLRAGVGLNDHSDRYFAGVGLSVRL